MKSIKKVVSQMNFNFLERVKSFYARTFVYLRVVFNILLTMMVIGSVTKSFPVPELVDNKMIPKDQKVNQSYRTFMAYILKNSRGRFYENFVLGFFNRTPKRSLSINWVDDTSVLLSQLNEYTPETISTIDSALKLRLEKLLVIFNQGCPGMEVNWRLCELNPSYSNIEKICLKMFELGLYEESYALQVYCKEDLWKLLKVTTKDLKELSTTCSSKV